MKGSERRGRGFSDMLEWPAVAGRLQDRDKACCGQTTHDRERALLASTEAPRASNSDLALRDLQVLHTCPLGQPASAACEAEGLWHPEDRERTWGRRGVSLEEICWVPCASLSLPYRGGVL